MTNARRLSLPLGDLASAQLQIIKDGEPRLIDIADVFAPAMQPFVDAASLCVAHAEAFAGHVYENRSAGEAASRAGTIFRVVSADGTLMAYLRTQSGSVELDPLATTAALSSPVGDAMVGSDDGADGALWSDIRGFIQRVRSSAGAAVAGFLPDGLSASRRTVQDKLREIPSLGDFGGFGDGIAHTVAEWISPGVQGRYSNLAALQVDYPHVTSVSDCANWAALTKAIKHAQDNSLGYAKLGAGVFVFTKRMDPSGPGIAIVGVENPNIQLGSTRTASTWRWQGGATAMIRTVTPGWVFHGFGVENGTVATDWLEMAPGSQRNFFTKIYATAPDGSERVGFSRSLIYSDGNRLGYGGMQHCVIDSVAPVLLHLQNTGTSNAVTTFFIDKNQFAASSQNLSVLKVTGETVEVLSLTQNTVIMNGNECCLLDTSAAPARKSIYSLVVHRNEFDINSSKKMIGAWRFMRLTKVANASITSNQVYGGGTLKAAFVLTGTAVSAQFGNYYYSVDGHFYEPDASSRIAPGHNVRNASNTSGDYPPDWLGNIERPRFGAAVVLDPSSVPGEHKIFHVDVTNSGDFEISCGAGKPYWHGAGQIMTVAVRNVSSGAIAAGSFRADHFVVDGPMIAPAAGQQRIFTFYYNGRKWTEISRSAADMPYG
jgi:hypothetical protein